MRFTRALSCALSLASFLHAQAPPPPTRPKLVVVLSIDQLSPDLLARHASRLGGGLARLMREGTYFTAAYHDHAFTETGPGHSVLLTGRTPAHTGIVENTWYDRGASATRYCVSDPSTKLLGPGDRAGASASQLLGSTLGDWLQVQAPGSRVFAVSGKDRAAILMAGQHPSGAFWMDSAFGFTTSTAYATALPEWLSGFDTALRQRLRSESWVWTPLHGESIFQPEDVALATGGVLHRNRLPKLIQQIGMPLDDAFIRRLHASPFYDEVTVEAAEALLEGEHLGSGKDVDLLALSLSSTDYIGHAYRPFSREMGDQIELLDLLLGRFLDQLRKRHPGVWVVLTADHGCTDVPEALQGQGYAALRKDPAAWIKALNAEVRQRMGLGKDPIVKDSEPKQLYLDDAAFEGVLDKKEATIQAILEALRTRPEVQFAVTRKELEVPEEGALQDPSRSDLRTLLKHSFHPNRSGDILIAFKPFVLTAGAGPLYTATHGSPHDYDRRVPLIFWGPWAAERRSEPVRTVDLAPTLAEALGVKPAERVDGHPLALSTTHSRSKTQP